MTYLSRSCLRSMIVRDTLEVSSQFDLTVIIMCYIFTVISVGRVPLLQQHPSKAYCLIKLFRVFA